MKPKELKIGDLVQVSKGCILPKGTICKVIGVKESYFNDKPLVSVATIDEGNERLLFYEEIEGIPLTSEILEKNCWEFYHGFYCSPNEKGARICLSSQTGYVWGAYIAGHTLCSDINSVSDLQHLFFGLGLNSEMEV